MSKNIYVYPYEINEFNTDQIIPCFNNIEGLRIWLLSHNQNKRESNFKGWDPEDYTIKNIDGYNKGFDKAEKFLINADLKDLLKYIEVNKIRLTTANPLTYNDFEKVNNPKILTKEEIIKLLS